MGAPVLVKERPGGKYTNDVEVRGHKQYVDEPLEFNSADLGPSPFEYVCAGLGGCTTITLRMYAGRKKWPLEHVSCLVSHENRDGQTVFVRQITMTGELSVDQRARLVEIANKCPVHKMLAHSALVETVEVT
ncbi:MAG: OsmC family protein [Maricaulaceae bacterium]